MCLNCRGDIKNCCVILCQNNSVHFFKMTVKHKTSKLVKVTTRRNAKSSIYTRLKTVEACKRKSTDHIDNIPDEILYCIFSHVPQVDLYFNVRLVCKRWQRLAADPYLWKTIAVSNNVATEVLSEWIKSAPFLTTLSLSNRNDVNRIAEDTSKHAKKLEKIEIINCWGSERSSVIYSKHLCNLVTRCPKLCTFNFARIKFASCKFFRLLMKDKRSGKITKRRSYFGPINANQLDYLLQTILENNLSERAIIRTVCEPHPSFPPQVVTED